MEDEKECMYRINYYPTKKGWEEREEDERKWAMPFASVSFPSWSNRQQYYASLAH